MVDTSLAALLPDGGFVVVFDDKLEYPVVCSIVSSTNAILTCSAGSELHTKSAISTHLMSQYLL